MTTVRSLDRTHPTYDQEYLRQCRALYEGGRRWHELVELWVPRNPQEVPANYAYRVSRATYENNAGPIVDLIKGGLFTEPPRVEDMDGAWASDWLKDVDGKGTDLTPWLEDFLGAAMISGRAYAWVNLPSVEQEYDSLAEQEASGALVPFLSVLDGAGVRNWGRDAKGKLLWVVHRGVEAVQEHPLAPRLRRYRWTIITTTHVSVWEWTAPPEQPDREPYLDEEATQTAHVPHGFGGLPIVELDFLDKGGLHAMDRLHDPAVALVRAQNDLDYGLHRAAHPILWVCSRWNEETPLVGAGVYFKLRRDIDGGGKDEMGYVSPDAGSLALLASRVTTQREGMYRVLHQMAQSADGNATRSQLSGDSKEADWRATEIILTAYAARLRPALTEVLRLVTLIRNGTAQHVNVTGLEGWHQENLMDWMLAAAQASTVVRFSETAIRMMAREEGRKLFPYASEAEQAQVEKEIQEADVNLEDFMPPPPGDGGADGMPEYRRDGDGPARRG